MTEVADSIAEILADNSLDDELVEVGKCELIEEIVTPENWPQVEQFLFHVLSHNDECYANWHTCFEVFWGAVLDERPVDGNRIIAYAYHRLEADSGSSESNLAWSLASKIKGESYLSKYDPTKDPVVSKITSEIES
jgi:hypothetical protein